MPRSKPKHLTDYPPPMVDALMKAMASPGARVPASGQLSLEQANSLHHKMVAMRNGLKVYQPEGSELWKAATNNRLRIERVYDYKNRDLRTVTIMYLGVLERPSETAARYMKEFIETGKVPQFRD